MTVQFSGEKTTPRSALYLFAASHGVHDLFTGVWVLVLASQRVALNLNYLQPGIAQGAYNLFSALPQGAFGGYFDRSGKPYLAIWSIALTTSMLLLAAFSGTYWLVVLAAAGLGIGSATFHSAGLSSARELSAGRGRGRATAIFLLGGNGGFALGAFMGGRILDNYGASTLLIPAAFVFMVTPFLVWRLRPYLVGLANAPTRTSREVLLGGYRSWLPIVALVVLVISVQTYYYGFTTYLPQYYESQGNSLSYAGTFSSLYLFFAAVGSFAGGALYDHFSRRMVAAISMLMIAPLSFLTLRADGPILTLLSILLGLTTNISFPILLLIGQEVMPGGRSGAGGYSFGLAFLARTASLPLVGWLADTFGLLETLTTIGILPVIVVGLFWLLPGEPSPG